MGENSKTQPETRLIDRETGESSVLRKKIAGYLSIGEISSTDCGVDRRTHIDKKSDKKFVTIIDSEKKPNNNNHETSEIFNFTTKNLRERFEKRSRDFFLDTSTINRPKNFLAILLSVLEHFRFLHKFFNNPRGKKRFSRGFAIVSLLVFVVFKPSVASPTNNVVFSGFNDEDRFNDPRNTRIMKIREESEFGDLGESEKREYGKFQANGDEVTVKMQRLGVAEEEEEQRNNDDEDDEYGEEILTTLVQDTRESGRLERRSRLRESELDTIRRSIVEGLGLERIPDPSKANVSQSEYHRAHQEYLTRLHSKAAEEERIRRLYTFHAEERSPIFLINRTRRSINDSSSKPPDVHQIDAKNASGSFFFFPIEIPEEDFLVDHVNLRLFVDPSDPIIGAESHTISIYRIASNSRQLVSRKKFTSDEKVGRWIELEVTELASLWYENGLENWGLQLLFENSERQKIVKQPKISFPALNIFTTSLKMERERGDKNLRRKRRASPEHLMSLHKGRRTECRGENKKCCRHQMTVIFKDLEGFEFIVQPKSFDAGYCKGRCPPRYNPAHHHALLQSLIWKEDKRKAPRPCCAPSKLDELEILYFDENDPTKLKVSSWKNMKVLECACS